MTDKKVHFELFPGSYKYNIVNQIFSEIDMDEWDSYLKEYTSFRKEIEEDKENGDIDSLYHTGHPEWDNIHVRSNDMRKKLRKVLRYSNSSWVFKKLQMYNSTFKNSGPHALIFPHRRSIDGKQRSVSQWKSCLTRFSEKRLNFWSFLLSALIPAVSIGQVLFVRMLFNPKTKISSFWAAFSSMISFDNQ